MKKIVCLILGGLVAVAAKSQEWTLTDGFPEDFFVYSITAEGGTSYAVGYLIPPTASTLYSSANGGEDWEKVCDIPDLTAGQVLVSQGRILMSGYALDGYVTFYSDDRGQTWTLLSDIPEDFLVSSLFKSGNRLMAAGSLTNQGLVQKGAVYISADNGTSWTRKDLPEEFQAVTSAAALGNNMVVAGITSEGPVLVRTVDDGKTWELSDISVPLITIAGVCSTPEVLYLAGRKTDGTGTLLVSKDGGATFSQDDDLSGDVFVTGLFSGPDRLFLTAMDPDQRSIVAYKEL